MKNHFYKLFLYCTIFMFIANKVVAQSIYHAGYVVTQNRDTIKGQILDGPDLALSKHIHFKSNPNNKENTVYSPADLLAFGFDYGRIFRRFRILSDSKTPDSVYVMAKKLSHGELDLYIIRNESEKSDFIVVNKQLNRQVHLNPPKSVIKEVKGQKMSFTVSKYIGLLNYVKGDSIVLSRNNKKLKYSEKMIRSDIRKYNGLSKDKYPTSNYKEKSIIDYDFAVGTAVPSYPDVFFIRLSADRTKTLFEKSEKLSFLIGIRYTLEQDKASVPTNLHDGNYTNRVQIINFIPLGVKFQTASRIVRPYIYCGLGVACFIDTHAQIENNKVVHTYLDFYPTLTYNIAVGARIKAGPNYILTEVAPIVGGLTLNLGYTFGKGK